MEQQDCAEDILAVAPRVMRTLRSRMSTIAKGQLTVPQLRVLVRLSKSDATYKEVAEWLSISPPTLSRMIRVLVSRKLVRQDVDTSDRRKVYLKLTPVGSDYYLKIRNRIRDSIEEQISMLSLEEKRSLLSGLKVLGKLFPEPK